MTVNRRGHGRGVRVALALAASVMVMLSAVSCAKAKDEFTYLRIQVDGQSTLAIGKNDILVRGIVMYFHGLDQDEFSMSTLHRDLTKDLVDAGFVVVSSKANGNSFADPKAVSAYKQLGSMAMQHYSINNIYFLAESVGAVPALNLMTEDYTPLRGMAAINPVLEAKPSAPAVPAEGQEPLPPVQNPMTIEPAMFNGQNINFYLSPGPSTARNDVTAFKDRFGSSARIGVTDCADAQGCPPHRAVLDWLLSIEVRH